LVLRQGGEKFTEVRLAEGVGFELKVSDTSGATKKLFGKRLFAARDLNVQAHWQVQ
jgi:hypothetical protein